MHNYSLVKIIVVESLKLIKEGLIILLNSFQNFVVIDEAEDDQELISKCRKNPGDIVLIDTKLINPDNLSPTHLVKKENDQMKIILMTMREEERIDRNKLKKLSNGIISKTISPNELRIAIERVMSGDFFLYHSSIKSDEHKIAEGKYELDGLTKRENEILYYLAKGLPSKDIADKLFLSPRTVDSHRSKIIQKYKLKTASELVHFAHEVLNNDKNGNKKN